MPIVPRGYSDNRRKKRKRFQRQKICRFTTEGIFYIDYKDVKTLKNMIRMDIFLLKDCFQ